LVEVPLDPRVPINCPLKDFMSNLGPTERSVSIPVPFVSKVWENYQIPELLGLSLGTTAKYNVTIDGGRYVRLDQNSIIRSLAVGPTSSLQLREGYSLTVENAFVNSGTVEKTEGTGNASFSGQITNAGLVSARSGTLILSGQVTNTGSLCADGGSLYLLGNGVSTTRAEAVNGGVLTLGYLAPFVNDGTLIARGPGSVLRTPPIQTTHSHYAGYRDIVSHVSGSGTIVVKDGALLELNARNWADSQGRNYYVDARIDNDIFIDTTSRMVSQNTGSLSADRNEIRGNVRCDGILDV
jgi:hypothetical protein